jgi:hypothetical protein
VAPAAAGGSPRGRSPPSSRTSSPGTMPDDALFAAARDGTLATPAGVEAQARRLLATPRRARVACAASCASGSTSTGWARCPRTRAPSPTSPPRCARRCRGEFDRYVDAALARAARAHRPAHVGGVHLRRPDARGFYGVTASTARPTRRDSAGSSMPEAQRRGVLTLGAVMAVHARPNSSSPDPPRTAGPRAVALPIAAAAAAGDQRAAPDPRPHPLAAGAVRDARQRCALRGLPPAHRPDRVHLRVLRRRGSRAHARRTARPSTARGEVVGSARSDTPLRDAQATSSRTSPRAPRCTTASRVSSSATPTPCRSRASRPRAPSPRCSALRDAEPLHPRAARGADALGAFRDARRATGRRERCRRRRRRDADAVVDRRALAVDAPATDAADARDAGRRPRPGVTTSDDPRLQPGRRASASASRDQHHRRRRWTWTVVHRIDGRVTTSWNSERVGDSGDVVFRGAMWNRTLAPGERTELGFCASR